MSDVQEIEARRRRVNREADIVNLDTLNFLITGAMKEWGSGDVKSQTTASSIDNTLQAALGLGMEIAVTIEKRVIKKCPILRLMKRLEMLHDLAADGLQIIFPSESQANGRSTLNMRVSPEALIVTTSEGEDFLVLRKDVKSIKVIENPITMR